MQNAEYGKVLIGVMQPAFCHLRSAFSDRRRASVELRICHLYPDLLNLYGDRGNIMVLVQRARWRGLPVTVTELGLGEAVASDAADLFFIGGGGGRPQRGPPPRISPGEKGGGQGGTP